MNMDLDYWVSCSPGSQGYAMLEDLDLENIQKDRLLYSLLNSRIILASLRGICLLRNLDYPKDLGKIQIRTSADYHYNEMGGIPFSGNGKNFFDWGIKIEEDICNAIGNSFYPL